MYDVKKKILTHVTTYTQWIGTHHISPYLTMLQMYPLCLRSFAPGSPWVSHQVARARRRNLPRLGRGLDVDFSSEKTGPQKWKDSLKFPGSRLRRVARMPMPSSVLHCRPTMVGRLGEQKLGCRTQMVCLAFKNPQHFVASRACHFDPYS